MRWFMSAMALVLVSGWLGCSSGNPPIIAETNPCVIDSILVGERLAVTISDIPGQQQPDLHVQVKDDGTISLPMGVNVVAAGKKLGQVEKEIHNLYVPKYYVQMSIAIKAEDRWYSVGGEVKQPGRQAHVGTVRVIQAIQSCGDFTDFANRRKVEIIRADGRHEVVDCKKARTVSRCNVLICPGDAVHVPRSL